MAPKLWEKSWIGGPGFPDGTDPGFPDLLGACKLVEECTFDLVDKPKALAQQYHAN